MIFIIVTLLIIALATLCPVVYKLFFTNNPEYAAIWIMTTMFVVSTGFALILKKSYQLIYEGGRRMDKDSFNKPSSDLMGEIIKEYAKTGGMDNLKGTGKPISEEYLSRDIFQHFQQIAKDAGFKPHWLNLQHEIRDELKDIAKKYVAEEMEGLHIRVTKVNEKIMQYNKSCPPPMQKGMVKLETIDSSSSRW